MPFIKKNIFEQDKFLSQESNFDIEEFYINYLQGKYSGTPLEAVKNILGVNEDSARKEEIKINSKAETIGGLPTELPVVSSRRVETFAKLPERMISKIKINISDLDGKNIFRTYLKATEMDFDGGVNISYVGSREKSQEYLASQGERGILLNKEGNKITGITLEDKVPGANSDSPLRMKIVMEYKGANEKRILRNVFDTYPVRKVGIPIIIETEFQGMVGIVLQMEEKYSLVGANESIYFYWGQVPEKYRSVTPGLD